MIKNMSILITINVFVRDCYPSNNNKINLITNWVSILLLIESDFITFCIIFQKPEG